MNDITILWLYPKEMNTYGDYGNILTLKKRLKWRGYDANIIEHNIGDAFPVGVDLIIGGGGQDSNQLKIHEDLLKNAKKIKRLADSGVPMLVVCGMYQLFGDSYTLTEGEVLKGIGVFEGVTTIATEHRISGNVTGRSDDFGLVVGYENHSGKTFLNDTQALATVPVKMGNNGQDETEGAVFRNVIGTYLHGSILPKNPKIADFLLKEALQKRLNKKITLKPLPIDKELTREVREVLIDRRR